MTGDQLRTLREGRHQTREELASYLGDTTASTINKWERNINPVPAWVEEKMLTNTELKFSIKELGELLQMATEEKISFDELLTLSIQSTLAERRAKKAKASKIIQLDAHIDPTKLDRAAETGPTYGKQQGH